MQNYNNSNGKNNNLILILLIVLISLVLIVAVTGIVYMLKNPVGVPNPPATDPVTDPITEPITDPVTDPVTEPLIDANGVEFKTVTVATETKYQGDIILVNKDYAYNFEANSAVQKTVTELYPIWKSYALYNYKLLNSSLFTTTRGAELINPLFDAFLLETAADLGVDVNNTAAVNKQGINDYMLTSFYRDYAEQEQTMADSIEKYGSESAALRYCAPAGHSEHHTGLAFDVKVFTDDEKSYALGEAKMPEMYNWIFENCAKYGFIQRYQAGKEAKTGYSEETWHFRYVGVPHAQIIAANNFCLEEYIDFIKGYSYDNYLTYDNGTNTYAIYFVEVDFISEIIPEVKDANGNIITPSSVVEVMASETNLPVPANFPYEISGNNVDGFIITITLK